MNMLKQLVATQCPNGVIYRMLGDLLDYEQPTPYIVSSTEYDDSYPTPVLTAGQSFILGRTKEETGLYKASPENPTIIFDDFTTSFHWVDFNFKVKSSAMKMLRLRAEEQGRVSFKYVYYAMQAIRYEVKEHTRQWISRYSRFEIPVPPLDVQQEIVRILDRYSALTRQLLDELEKEHEARKKQYEYYRNALLVFARLN